MEVVIKGGEGSICKFFKINRLYMKRNGITLNRNSEEDREDELYKQSIKQLKLVAENLEIENYSSLKKKQLIDSILIQEELNSSTD